MTTLYKELIGVEDLLLSMDSVVLQQRGDITPFNAAYLPYSATESVAQAITNRYTKSETATRYAPIAGLATQVFAAATATLDTQAVPKLQMDTADALKADKTEVIRKGAGETYSPVADTDPVNKGYSDGLIADKFLGAVTAQFKAYSIADGTTPVTVTITNGVITGVA